MHTFPVWQVKLAEAELRQAEAEAEAARVALVRQEESRNATRVQARYRGNRGRQFFLARQTSAAQHRLEPVPPGPTATS